MYAAYLKKNVSLAGALGWRDLGGGGEVAPATADTGRLEIHQKPGGDDLGHGNPEEPQRDWRRYEEEERCLAQTTALTKQAQNRPR